MQWLQSTKFTIRLDPPIQPLALRHGSHRSPPRVTDPMSNRAVYARLDIYCGGLIAPHIQRIAIRHTFWTDQFGFFLPVCLRNPLDKGES